LGSEEKEDEPVEDISILGCGDEGIGDKQAPVIEVSCVKGAGKIPNNILSSDSNKVYKDFYGATVGNHQTLQWTADLHGNLENSTPHRRMLLKRLPWLFSPRGDDSERFKGFKFKLDWAPNKR
jgi:hypothetical protein